MLLDGGYVDELQVPIDELHGSVLKRREQDMAKVKLNPILEQLRGKVGDLVFKRFGDEIIISRTPDMEGREWSEAQLAARERFRQASVYGKMVMADPDTKAVYEEAAQRRGQPMFSLTIADFLNAPSIDEVDVSEYGGAQGDIVRIQAHDDFEVTQVRVSITDSEGNVLESGDAVVSQGFWTYTAPTDVPTGTSVRISVTALDRPGSVVESTEEKIV